MAVVDNDGVRIHYEVEGDGPPLMLMHGMGGSIENWRRAGYIDALKAQYRLILVDSRGFGGSDKPHDIAAYTREAKVSDVTRCSTISGSTGPTTGVIRWVRATGGPWGCCGRTGSTRLSSVVTPFFPSSPRPRRLFAGNPGPSSCG